MKNWLKELITLLSMDVMFLQNGITLKEEYAAIKMDVVIVPIPVYKLSEGV